MADQMTRTEMNALTASAIRKAHTRGARGIEMITHDEITALIGTVIDLSAQALTKTPQEENPND
ncbi:MAG: hypothetical protein EP318_06125 [Rhodobacteraceae bacterium]|nr:MAG: hypothetical protein EP318_06125 [Paracoccaceae bacterium]